MTTFSLLLAIGLYVLSLIHHWLALRAYDKALMVWGRNRTLVKTLREALALAQYGAKQEAIDLVRSLKEDE